MSKQKFNVGDRVVINKKYQSVNNSINGAGTVTSFRYFMDGKNKYTVKWDDSQFSKEYYSYELNKCADHVDTTHVDTELKIGDKVVFSEEGKKWIENSRYFNIDVDKVYTIWNNYYFGSLILYELQGVDTVFFMNEDLKKVDDNYDEPETPIDSNPDSNTEQTTISSIKTRQERWNDICNEYLKEFCDKHEWQYEPDMWVAGNVGTIVMIGDMFVSMNNIRYDIDNNVPTDYFEKWYWKSIEISELTDEAENYMNYENYCKEAPDYWTEERVQKIRASKKRVEEDKNELLKAIEDTRKGKF